MNIPTKQTIYPLLSFWRNCVPVSEQSWLVAALRQDNFVWSALQDETFAYQALSLLSEQAMHWSPAALALLASELPLNAEDLRADSSLQPDAKVLSAAIKAFEIFSHANAGNLTTTTNLQQAGLAALLLRERRRKIGSWQGLIDELMKIHSSSLLNWKTPLACLFGLINDPDDLLISLTEPGTVSHPVDPKWIVQLICHIILSNPLNFDEQARLFQKIIQHGKLHLGLILDVLSAHRPELAQYLANWILEQDITPINASVSYPYETLLANLNSLVWQATLQKYAGNAVESMELLNQARHQVGWLTSELAAAWTSQAEAFTPSQFSQEIIASAWRTAAKPTLPGFGQEQAQAQNLSNPEFEEALKIAEYRCSPKLLDENSGQAADQPGLLVEMARQHLAQHDLIHAIQLCQQALSALKQTTHTTTGDQADRLAELSEMFLEMGLPASALDAAQTCLVTFPACANAMRLAGMSLERLEQPDLAVNEYLNALLIAPDVLDYRRLFAGSLEKIQSWEEALAVREEIVQASAQIGTPEFVEDLHKLASCARQAGAYVQAIHACEQALSFDNLDWQARFEYGQVFSQMGDLEHAAEQIQQVVEIAPQQPAGWLELAAIHQKSGNQSKAGEILSSAIQVLPDCAELHLAMGEIQASHNAKTQALAAYQTAFELANQGGKDKYIVSRAGLRYGSLLNELGHAIQAREVLEPIFQRQSENPEIARAYASSLVSLEDFSTALPVLNIAIENSHNVSDCQDALLLSMIGKTLLNLKNDLSRAVECLQRSLDLQPNDIETQSLLAEALVDTHDYEGALKTYRLALDSAIGQTDCWQFRLTLGFGRAALALGRADIALASFQEAANLEPNNAECQRLLAESNWLAGLGQDAWSAAKSAFQFDPGIPCVLWLAERVLAWFESESSLQGRPVRSSASKTPVSHNVNIEEILGEAAMLLGQAHLLYPDSAEIALVYGKIQLRAGKEEEGGKTIASLAALPGALPASLEDAASNLLKLAEKSKDDNAQASHLAWQAALCLEAAARFPSDSAEISTQRYLRLSDAYRRAGKSEKMLGALEEARRITPTHPGIYQCLLDYWIAEGEVEKALNVLNEADRAINDSCALVDLLLKGSSLCRNKGHLAQAFYHAEHALSCSLLARTETARPVIDGERSFVNLLESADETSEGATRWDETLSRLRISELYWALMLPERARLSLPGLISVDSLTGEEKFCYHCLKTELALEAFEEIEAANHLTRAIALYPDHPWALALQARLLHKQKDQPLAVQALLKVAEQIDHSYPSQVYVSISRAAADMAEWSVAIQMAQRAAESEAVMNGKLSEPLPALNLAELFVRQAEFAGICEELGVLKHTPHSAAFEPASQKMYLEAIQSAETTLLQVIQENASLTAPSNAQHNQNVRLTEDTWRQALEQIARWKCRGAAVFNCSTKKSEIPAGWATWQGYHMLPDDHAAQLAAIRRDKSHNTRPVLLTRVREIVEAYPRYSLTLLQCGLALAEIAPAEALRYCRTAAEILVNTPRHPLNILAHRLLAQLEKQAGSMQAAMQAIHIALAAWPDEARWHNLAARIRIGLPDEIDLAENLPAVSGLETRFSGLPDAQAYLEEAVRLEPDNAEHAILLSQVFQSSLREDPLGERKALRVLESASKENPDNADLWLALATLYRQNAEKAKAGGKTERKQLSAAASSAIACAERAGSLAEEQGKFSTAAEAHILLGYLALDKGDSEEGYRQARLSLRLQPNNPPCILLQVDCLEALGRSEDAITVLDKSLALSPNSLSMEIKRAALMSVKTPAKVGEKTLSENGQDSGLAVLEKLAQQHPDEPKVHLALAKSLANLQRVDEAIEHAQQALAVVAKTSANGILEGLSAKEVSELHMLLGKLYSDLGHLDQAIYQYDQAINHQVNNVEAYLALANVYQKQRSYLKAQEILKEAINVAPGEPRVYYYAGMVFKNGHNLKEAETMLHKAVSLSPDDLSLRKQLASVMAANLMQSRQNISQAVDVLDGGA